MTIRQTFVCEGCRRQTTVELDEEEEPPVLCKTCTSDEPPIAVEPETFDPMRPAEDHSGDIPYT